MNTFDNILDSLFENIDETVKDVEKIWTLLSTE